MRFISGFQFFIFTFAFGNVILFAILFRRLYPTSKQSLGHASDHSSRTKFCHWLICIILLNHFVVIFRMLYFYVLVQTSFRPIRFWAVIDWTFVVSGYLCCCSSVSLFLFIIDFERHTEHVFVFTFVALKKENEIWVLVLWKNKKLLTSNRFNL